MNLKHYKELGITEIVVTDGLAVALNPYSKVEPESELEGNASMEIESLPTIEAPSIRNGTYPIDRFEDECHLGLRLKYATEMDHYVAYSRKDKFKHNSLSEITDYFYKEFPMYRKVPPPVESFDYEKVEEELKQTFYKKLLQKLLKLNNGEMTLAEYIKEVTNKIK